VDIALWVLTVANTAAIILIFRQLVMITRGYNAPRGLSRNAPLPEWRLRTLDGSPRGSTDYAFDHLLLVVSQRCAPCRDLLDEIRANPQPTLYPIVVASDGEQDAVRERLAGLLRSHVHSVLIGAEEGFKARLNVPGTPHAIAIRADGRVAAAGGVNTLEHVHSLMRQLDAFSAHGSIGSAAPAAKS
jgi:hypothetical protein